MTISTISNKLTSSKAFFDLEVQESQALGARHADQGRLICDRSIAEVQLPIILAEHQLEEEWVWLKGASNTLLESTK